MTLQAATAVVEAIAAGIAIARILSLQLAGTFPAVLSFLSIIAVSAAAGSFFHPASRAYFWIYIGQTPFYCVLALFSARELFSLVFKQYPGIRTAGRMAIYWCAGSASVIAILSALAHWGPKIFFTHLVYVELARRSIVLSVALFLVFILFSLSRYPLHLARNVVVSSAIFSILFLSQAAQLLIDSFSSNLYSRQIDTVNVIFGAMCTFVWASLLQPEPARAPVIVKYSSEQEQQLLRQLDGLNQMLTRAARR